MVSVNPYNAKELVLFARSFPDAETKAREGRCFVQALSLNEVASCSGFAGACGCGREERKYHLKVHCG